MHAPKKTDMSQNNNSNTSNAFKDRERTNILWPLEKPTISFLCKIMPRFISSDMLTAIGLMGSVLVTVSFYLATLHGKAFLFLAILGFAINWFGDSLDGRIAYYRSTPRKWYGFSLDVIMDWLSLVLMAVGYYLYIPSDYKILVFLFACAYAWAMLIAQLRYKLTDKYTIDSGLLGPTETRVIICLVILAEILFSNSIKWFSIIVNILLWTIDIIDTYKLLQIGNAKDEEERKMKELKNKA